MIRRQHQKLLQNHQVQVYIRYYASKSSDSEYLYKFLMLLYVVYPEILYQNYKLTEYYGCGRNCHLQCNNLNSDY